MEKHIVYGDQELLGKIKNNDNEAFEILYYRYFAQLSRHAFKKLREEDLTEELVQDVFVEFWKKRATLDDNGNVAGLLFAILRNKALHELRSRMIQNKHMEAYTQLRMNDAAVENAESLYEQELRRKMEMAISRLSPQCKEAFTLSRYEHLSHKDIAIRMNISVNTVEKHIGKALLIMRKEFRDYQLPVLLLTGLLELALSSDFSPYINS